MASTRKRILALCCLIMVCEGIDLVVFGNVIPLLLNDSGLGINKSAAGTVGSLAFVGMFVGGMLAGKINCLLDSKRSTVAGTACFSLATLFSSLSLSLVMLSLTRFATGVGLGIVLPIAISTARGGATNNETPLIISVVMAGIPIGGTVATFAVASFTHLGWRLILAFAAGVGFAISLLVSIFMPAQKTQVKIKTATHSFSDIFLGRSRKMLMIACCFAALFDLFAYYGVTTWLTQLMCEFDIPLENSLQLSLVLNAGAVFGSLGMSVISLRIEPKIIALVSGFLAGISLLVVSTKPESAVSLVMLLVLIGAFAISAQNHLNALVTNAFPEEIRSSALGIVLGIGRLGAIFSPLCGGALLQMGYGAPAVLVCFGVASLAGCLSLGLYTQSAVEKSLAASKREPLTLQKGHSN